MRTSSHNFALNGGLTGLALLMSNSVVAAWPQPEDPQLKAGRVVWVGVCRECHGSMLSDAPQARDPKAWAARIAQGRDTLYRHALDGFQGPTGTEMPPRGGSPGLSDDEVRAAVDYMLYVVEANATDGSHH